MHSRVLAFGIVCISPACQAAELSGQQRAEMLVQAAQQHLSAHQLRRSVRAATGSTHRGSTEVCYDRRPGDRFATFYVAPDGRLREFVLNGPDAEPYIPFKERRVFIERMMGIVAPDAPHAERTWGAEQLDRVWTRRTRPLPVQVGSFVFRGMTVSSASGAHDTFWIVAANTGATGLRYRK